MQVLLLASDKRRGSSFQTLEMSVQLTSEILPFYQGKRILIVGGSGFLGTNLVELLKDIDCQIICLARTERRSESVKGRAEIRNVRGDVRDSAIPEQILQGVDIVFHLAAQTSIYVADENPIADLEINVLPMLRILETCRRRDWHPIVIFSGTVTEVGIPTRLPVDENYPDRPVTIYDLHKLTAESYLKYYASLRAVRGATLRLSNVYGPGPESSSADRGVLNMMVRKALQSEALSVYGNGDCLRDYVYVQDVMRAFLMAGANIEKINGQHFVIGSGQGYTLTEAFNLVAERVALKTGKRVPVRHIEPETPQSPIETRNFVADSSGFTLSTGWRPGYSLAEGIDLTAEAYLQQSSRQ